MSNKVILYFVKFIDKFPILTLQRKWLERDLDFLLKHEYTHMNAVYRNAENARFLIDLDEFELELILKSCMYHLLKVSF